MTSALSVVAPSLPGQVPAHLPIQTSATIHATTLALTVSTRSNIARTFWISPTSFPNPTSATLVSTSPAVLPLLVSTSPAATSSSFSYPKSPVGMDSTNITPSDSSSLMSNPPRPPKNPHVDTQTQVSCSSSLEDHFPGRPT